MSKRSMLIYFSPRMLLLGWLGMISGLPLALTSSTLYARLADSNIDVETIGLFALVGLPYAFKFVWAPLMDGLTPYFAIWWGKRRAWMVWCVLTVVACTWALSIMNVTGDLKFIAIMALALAFCSASFDINFDAFRIEWLPKIEQGAGAAMATTGWRIGALTSGAGALFIAEFISWSVAYQVMGLIALIGLAPVLLAPNPEKKTTEKADKKPNKKPRQPKSLMQWLEAYVVDPFYQFTLREKWWLILLFIFLFKLGDAVLGIMTKPFLINVGYGLTDIALVVSTYGMIATIIGAFIGGWLVIRLGIMKSLLLGGILQSAANLPYALLALLPEPNVIALGFTVVVDNAFGGFATTAFVAYISMLCNKRFTATQYALLSSLASVGRTVVSAGSGFMVTSLGWPIFFVATALLGLPALLILWFLPDASKKKAKPKKDPKGEESLEEELTAKT